MTLSSFRMTGPPDATGGLSDAPFYYLTGPLLIGSRLLPAVKVADGYVAVEANGVELDENRVHFRYHIDVTGVGTYTSPDSDVTVVARDWTHAAALALEVVCEALGGDDGPGVEGLPDTLVAWLKAGAYMDAYGVGEDLREYLAGLG